MATDNDNIFAAGDSRPSGDTPNGDGKPASRPNGTEGRVDPVIARASADAGGTASLFGDGNGNGSGNAPGNTTGTPGRKGGWPKGKPRGQRTAQPAASARPAETEARPVKASIIERVLLTVHNAAFLATKIPELELDQAEAKQVGVALADVLKFHNVALTEEQEKYYNLVETLGTVYGLRVMAFYARKQAEQMRAKKGIPPGGAKTLHLRPVPDTPAPAQAPQTKAPPPPPEEFKAPPQTVDPNFQFDPFKITIENG